MENSIMCDGCQKIKEDWIIKQCYYARFPTGMCRECVDEGKLKVPF